MSGYRALKAYEELLRGFQNQLSQHGHDIAGMLESGFGYLISKLNLLSISLFDWDEHTGTLAMQYNFREGILMEGEEVIEVHAHSPILSLVHEQIPVVTSARDPWIAYIPLSSEGKLVGAIRFERERPLPRGRILSSMPRVNAINPNHQNEFPFLEDIGDIISMQLDGVHREENHRRNALYLKAGSEVATAVVETPRLREMLDAVAKSIGINLGFDRIRFYLIDPSHTELRGILGFQIPDRLLSMDDEIYPLRLNVNSLVNAVLDAKSEERYKTAGGKVVYIPLMVGGQVIGCMAADNLLSQVVIDDQQVATLRSLAGQIGMAVLNARLFEDIEQQAITDGLTKLYVYRYFQQRLKEELDRADRYSYSVALVMIDVDNFKNFNDTYGHALGDKVLEFLAQTIRGNIRRIDLAARYGGDEFILLLPEITEQEAWLMGTRLLNALKESEITASSGEQVQVRVTLGVAMYVNDARNGRDLMEAADRALYWAKKNSRGDMCFYRNISKKVEKTA